MDYFLNIPNKVDKILRMLTRAGFDAYVVGGCVRDILMGRKPHDWDITTSATPAETKECFKGYKVIETGIKHGTVTVLMDGEPFEITTFRSDGTYSDGRHPDSVSFSKDVTVDLARRDFTMNALAYSPSKGLIDEYGGLSDINNRIIKAVGAPEERFAEDSLRILRAIRFAGTLGFMLEPETARAVKALAGTAGRASAERIMTEINKLLMGAYAAYAVKLYRTEINDAISFSGAHVLDKKAVKALEHAPASLPLRLALVLDVPDEGKQMSLLDDGSDQGQGSSGTGGGFNLFGWFAESGWFGFSQETDITGFSEALRKMKYDNDTIRRTVAVKEISVKQITPDEIVVLLEMRKLADSFPTEEVPDILIDGISVRSLRGKLSDSATEKLFGIISGIMESGKCYSRSQLAISGNDIMNKIGDIQGKDVGRILSALLDEVIAGELSNEHDSLLARSKELYKLLVLKKV